MFFASLSFWANVSGILGLVTGVAGLVFTVWTWRKAGSIEKTLNETQNKHLLSVRAPEYIKRLRDISKKIIVLLDRNDNVQADLTPLIAETQVLCRSLKTKIETSRSDNSGVGWQLKFLEQLETHVHRMLPSRKEASLDDGKNLDVFLEYTNSLLFEIEDAVKNQKESI